MKKMTASCYLIIKPTHIAGGVVREINISRMTKTQPALEPGEIAVKTRVNVTHESFEPSTALLEVEPHSGVYVPTAEVVADAMGGGDDA
ncbi:hypothetical protein [Nesterenkonia populi]|uniref:hypothetical protein n=1 Tax=Nesterenkonia populi TaxID=1591087 RepID=UPI0011BD487C|nr:hypothetical protein [Nesterenkonia populi]